MILLLSLLLLQNDKAQANAYDDAWEPGPTGWVERSKSLYTVTGKTLGMVLHIGDSITHSNPYGQWARGGAGKTAEDAAILAWCMAAQSFPASPTPTDTNGYYLCAVDVANRSMTASGGLTTGEYLSGAGNGGTDMPSTADTAAARNILVETLPTVPPTYKYTGNLHITTVAAAFANAQFAVVMLGTNDVRNGRPVADFTNDLAAIVDVLEGRNIVVVISTIPPLVDFDVLPFNAAVRTFASGRKLPLIDYYQEILLRRPGTSWQNTLISGDKIHPTSADSAADPYSPGGNPATHQTGDNVLSDGYLLRGWLTVQKLKEVKSFVVDGATPPSTPPVTPPSTPPSTPPAVAGSSGSDNDNGCSCGTATPSGLPGAALALLSLAWALRRK